MSELVLELVDYKNALRSVSKLDESLQDSAAIMLVAKLCVLLTNGVDALLHCSMFLLTAHFLLLHQQPVVRNAQLLDQVRHLLLLTAIENGLLTTTSFRLILVRECPLADFTSIFFVLLLHLFVK